jgi:hypothetical protein
MSANASGKVDAIAPRRGEPLVLPGGETLALEEVSDRPKLPPPQPPEATSQAPLPEAFKDAWTQYMIRGFEQNEQMFRNTLDAFIKPYRLTVWLYATLFALGIGLFIVAAVIGLRNEESVVAIAFAGLGVAAFLAFFLRQPLHALEENLEFITWLSVVFNTYWTRLMYLSDPKAVQADLKAAKDDFRASVEKLIGEHAKLRGQRPGGD